MLEAAWFEIINTAAAAALIQAYISKIKHTGPILILEMPFSVVLNIKNVILTI